MRFTIFNGFLVVWMVCTVGACGGSWDMSDRAMHLKIKHDGLKLALALREYEMEVPPEDHQDLTMLTRPNAAVPGWKPRLKSEDVLDPWKNAYVIRIEPKTGEKQVWTLGADGKQGGTERAADFAIQDPSTWPAWFNAAAAANDKK